MFADLPSMKYLVAFEAVARHCSIAKAASEVSLTSSALSKQIQALETHVGVKLFSRSTRRIELTESGKKFAKVVDESLRKLHKSINDIAPQTDHNNLRLVASTGFISYVLAPKLAEFKAAHPSFSFSFSSLNTSVIPDFEIAQVDAAVVLLFDALNIDGLSLDPIFKGCYLQPMCAPSLLPDGLPFNMPEQLSKLTWLKNRAVPDLWDRWLYHAGAPDLQPCEVCWFDDATSLFEAAAAGVGVSMTGGAENAPTSPRLVAAHSYRAYSDVASYYLVYPSHGIRKPALRAFRHWLLGVYNADHIAKLRV